MEQFKPIRHVPTYIEIVEQISKKIKNKELLPGEKLPAERALATHLNIGRQCLREALSVLQVIGLIEVKKGRGTYVRENIPEYNIMDSLNIDEVGDPFALMEARKAIETRTAFLAATRAQEEDLAVMDEIILKMDKMTKKGEHASELDKSLHLLIAKSSRNQVFYNFMRIIVENMGKKLWLILKERSLLVADRNNRYFNEHVKLVEAIKIRDARLAEKLMYQHLNGIEEDLRSSPL